MNVSSSNCYALRISIVRVCVFFYSLFNTLARPQFRFGFSSSRSQSLTPYTIAGPALTNIKHFALLNLESHFHNEISIQMAACVKKTWRQSVRYFFFSYN